MKNIKTIAITFIVAGALFIGGSSYAALQFSNPTAPAPKEEAKAVERNVTVEVKVEKKKEIENIKSDKTLTVEERLNAIEKRLDKAGL